MHEFIKCEQREQNLLSSLSHHRTHSSSIMSTYIVVKEEKIGPKFRHQRCIMEFPWDQRLAENIVLLYEHDDCRVNNRIVEDSFKFIWWSLKQVSGVNLNSYMYLCRSIQIKFTTNLEKKHKLKFLDKSNLINGNVRAEFTTVYMISTYNIWQPIITALLRSLEHSWIQQIYERIGLPL
jgi:hypothetical protein